MTLCHKTSDPASSGSGTTSATPTQALINNVASGKHCSKRRPSSLSGCGTGSVPDISVNLLWSKNFTIIDKTYVKKQQLVWTYDSATTKILHCWSEFIRVIFLMRKQAHGGESAKDNAKNKPPSLEGGRWHVFLDARKRLLKARQSRLAPILSAAIIDKQC